MNKLIGIIYLSEATKEFTKSSLLDLAHQSAKSNKLVGITGYLYFVKGRFFQYFEGEEKFVQNLYEIVENDPRHKIVNSLYNQNITVRKFPSWDMKFITKDMLTEIKMENLVLDRMDYIKKVNDITRNKIDVNEQEESVWRMIDTISRLSNYF